MRFAVALLAVLVPAVAVADQSELTEAQKHQLEKLRHEVASQLQLQAYDLLDELVFGWMETPPFATETPVVLADVSVPVGFGSGLEALVENHFANLLVKNPRSRLVLSHCPACNQPVIHSGKTGTIVARGVDQPEALAKAGAASGSRHAIFLDFEAEGPELVLRARITSLEKALPIVYARTLSTATSSAALLRSPVPLKSAADAREEYLDALRGRGTTLVPIRLGVRTYAQGDGPDAALASIPFIWLQAGGEVALTQTRAWTASLLLGATWLPERHDGWMAQGRINRLLSGSTTSLTHPDLYAFLGLSIVTIRGPGAGVFLSETPTVEQLLGTSPLNTTFGSLQIGMDLRVGNRVGVGVFLEAAPTLESPNIGDFVDFIFRFQTFGAEVSFCF